jgi:tetratricopeptide (TPR) repeat protein
MSEEPPRDILKECVPMITAGRIAEVNAILADLEGKPDTEMFNWLTIKAGVAMKLLDFRTALVSLNKAELYRPLDMSVYYNKGMCHYQLGEYELAIAEFRRTLHLNPTFAKAWMKLGGSFLPIQKFAEALACQEKAIRLDPADPELYIGLGTTISLFNDDVNAIAAFRKCKEILTELGMHEVFECDVAMGHVLLRAGQWEEGWSRIEERWKLRPHGAPWDHKPMRPWIGPSKELRDKKVLIYAEQGYGDSLHFSRYIPWVMSKATKVAIIGPPPLKRILEAMDCKPTYTSDFKPEEYDIVTSLMSLPYVFDSRSDGTNVPPPSKFKVKAREIPWPAGKPRVGICWHGDARPHDPIANADDQRRSIPWELFKIIPETTPCVSLQYEDLQQWGCSDWVETAEFVKGLDLVITVDTAMCHLSASLGVPTWMLGRHGGCWRWLSTGEKTVWYPAMKIYRQPVLCDWRPIVHKLRTDLANWVVKHG